MQRQSCCTLLTVPDSINSTGTRILHHLLPWLPSASPLLLLLLHLPAPPSSATPTSQGVSVLSRQWCDPAVVFELLLKRQGVFFSSSTVMQTKEQDFLLCLSKAHYFRDKRSLGDGAMIPQLLIMK